MRQLFIGLVLLLLTLEGCRTGVVPVSKRELNNKPGTMRMHGRGPYATKRPDLYVQRKVTRIRPAETKNTTGSLFNIDDQRNYLYLTSSPPAVGQYVTVAVSSKFKKPADPAEKKEAGADESSGDAFVKEMLAAMPELDPAEGDNQPVLMKQMKMKIDYIFENGDALVTMKRKSVQGTEGNEISVRGRLPYTSLIAGRSPNTNDLSDVHWFESRDGQTLERYSSAWEDEYSLRLSGFNEARSKYAAQLKDKRQQLDGVKKKLRNQLISLGKERKTMAKEREKVLEDKAKVEERVAKMQEQIDQHKEEIKRQQDLVSTKEAELQAKQDEINSLQPEEKPGDEKDGAQGQ